MNKTGKITEKDTTPVVTWQSIVAILAGLVLIFGASIWSISIHPVRTEVKTDGATTDKATASKEQTLPNGESCTLTTACQETLQTVGVALIGFGIFAMLLDTRNWREYFGKRLEEVVVRQSYLDQLDMVSLKALQVKVLKAFFHDSTIDREGSFLNYFQTNLHHFISEPYREDVAATIELREEVDGCYRIFDRLAYTCRKAGDTIQESANWFPDKDEFRKVESMTIRVKYPYWHPKKGEFETVYDLADEEQEINLATDSVSRTLEKFKDVDQLIVIIEAIYLIEVHRFQYWQMAHPTKNFTFVITHSKEYSLQVKPLVLDQATVETTKGELSSMVKCDAWMLPQSGLAWRFLKKEAPEPAIS